MDFKSRYKLSEDTVEQTLDPLIQLSSHIKNKVTTAEKVFISRTSGSKIKLVVVIGFRNFKSLLKYVKQNRHIKTKFNMNLNYKKKFLCGKPEFYFMRIFTIYLNQKSDFIVSIHLLYSCQGQVMYVVSFSHILFTEYLVNVFA